MSWLSSFHLLLPVHLLIDLLPPPNILPLSSPLTDVTGFESGAVLANPTYLGPDAVLEHEPHMYDVKGEQKGFVNPLYSEGGPIHNYVECLPYMDVEDYFACLGTHQQCQ